MSNMRLAKQGAAVCQRHVKVSLWRKNNSVLNFFPPAFPWVEGRYTGASHRYLTWRAKKILHSLDEPGHIARSY